jgi:hypothetical protein
MSNRNVGNTENSMGCEMYIVSKITPMDRAIFNATNKSTRTGGSGIIINPTIMTRPNARAISRDLNKLRRLEIFAVGLDATM